MRGAVSEKWVGDDSEGLRELDAVTVVVVVAEGREMSLERELTLSEALLERRRWKGLR